MKWNPSLRRGEESKHCYDPLCDYETYNDDDDQEEIPPGCDHVWRGGPSWLRRMKSIRVSDAFVFKSVFRRPFVPRAQLACRCPFSTSVYCCTAHLLLAFDRPHIQI